VETPITDLVLILRTLPPSFPLTDISSKAKGLSANQWAHN
jgi:hypothetical protein